EGGVEGEGREGGGGGGGGRHKSTNDVSAAWVRPPPQAAGEGGTRERWRTRHRGRSCGRRGFTSSNAAFSVGLAAGSEAARAVWAVSLASARTVAMRGFPDLLLH